MKLLTYSPDADPTSPGIVLDGNNFIPTTRGLAGAPGDTSGGIADLASACVGAATVLRLDSATRVFAATSTKLYEASSGSWADVSRSSGGAYSAASNWRFAQFGNISLAASKANVMQQSASGAFSNISGAPKASIIETVGQQVLAFDTDDGGSYGDRPDSWWSSALGDYTDWTPAIATQSATGRLTDIPGRITAARRFGDGIFVGKERGVYFGKYAGPPFIWEFITLPGDFGPVGQDACIQIGTSEQPRLMYLGLDNFYMFDGARPYPIGELVRETFFRKANTAELGNSVMLHDVSRALVYVFYPLQDSEFPNAGVVYHYKSDRWGVVNLSVRAAMNYATPAITFGAIDPAYTFATIPNVPFGELFTSPGTLGTPAFINSSKQLRLLNGASGSSYLVTGHYGDDLSYSFARRIKIRWIKQPASGKVEGYSQRSLGESLVKRSESNMQPDGRFNLNQSGRWHRFTFSFGGNWEMNDFTPDTELMGLE